MGEPVVITYVQREPLPKLPTYIAECCREWIAPFGFGGGRCGLCGTRPVFKRADPDSPVPADPGLLAYLENSR